MKILYIITRSEAGGAQTHVLELLRGFKNSAELHLATGEDGVLCDQARALGIPVYLLSHLIQPLHPLKDALAMKEIFALIKHIQPDLVHMHSSKAGLLGRIAASLNGVPFVFTAHGWAFTDGTPAARKTIALMSEWLAGKLGGFIITVSEYDYRLARHYRIISQGQIKTIHHGLPDVPPDLRAEREIGDLLRLIMVARFAPPKDYKSLLIALAQLHDLPWELEAIGDGPLLPAMREVAAQLGLLPRVNFAGSQRDVAERLARSHLFVLISNYEGLPLSILEAMRTGLPVVASDVGGVREAVVDGQTGFLVPRGDVATLVQRLRQLLCNPLLIRQMGKAGRKHFEVHFTSERMLKETMAVYEQLLRHGSANPKNSKRL